MKFFIQKKNVYSMFLSVMVFMLTALLVLPVCYSQAGVGGNRYRIFNIKINIEWSVNKDKIQSGSTAVHETFGEGTVEVAFYFPPKGGEALRNLALGKITKYDNRNNPIRTTFSGAGVTNETISFYKPVWDGKNTITISGVEYTAIPIDVTFHNPVKPVSISEKSVWDRMLGAFTESVGVGKIREFKIETAPGANNYFPKVSFAKDWHVANITFVVTDKGMLEN